MGREVESGEMVGRLHVHLAHACPHAHAHTCTFTHTHIHTHAHMQTHTLSRAHKRTHTHTHIAHKHTYTSGRTLRLTPVPLQWEQRPCASHSSSHGLSPLAPSVSGQSAPTLPSSTHSLDEATEPAGILFLLLLIVHVGI